MSPPFIFATYSTFDRAQRFAKMAVGRRPRFHELTRDHVGFAIVGQGAAQPQNAAGTSADTLL